MVCHETAVESEFSTWFYQLQWNPSITDTLGTQNFVHYNGVSLSQGFRYISGRRGMRNQTVEHNVAGFSELSFAMQAGNATQRLVLRVTVMNLMSSC